MNCLAHRFGTCRQLRALAVVLAVSALLAGTSTAADAHDILAGTAPADGSTVASVPAQVTLTFTEPALAVGTIVIVTGPAGPGHSGAAILVGKTVTEHLRPGSPAGRYTVAWRVTSTDGHPVSGRFSFTATSASPAQQATATAPATATTSVPPPTPTTATKAATPPTTTTPTSGTTGDGFPGWWVAAGGAVVLLLLLAFILTRRSRRSQERAQL